MPIKKGLAIRVKNHNFDLCILKQRSEMEAPLQKGSRFKKK
jgi:hypothetical protein